MMNFLTKIAKGAAIGAALLTSTSAFAQWQGTWDTSYGRIKLHQNQMYVYGDYGNWGTIEAMASPDRRTLWGIYRRNDDGSYGYFEWYRDHGTSFKGRWQNDRMPVPKWKSRGTPWNGTLRSSAKPALSVYNHNGDIGAFMGRAPGKYKVWYSYMMEQLNKPEQAEAAKPKGPTVNPLATKFPKLKDYQANWKPQWFELDLKGMRTPSRKGEADIELYGTVDVFAYCETPSGTRRLRSYANKPARVFDHSRDNVATSFWFHGMAFDAGFGSSADRKFPLDAACLKDPNGRHKITVSTDLIEKDLFKRGDDPYGKRSFSFYLDQLPSSKDSDHFDVVANDQRVEIDAQKGIDAPVTMTIVTGYQRGLEIRSAVRFTK